MSYLNNGLAGYALKNVVRRPVRSLSVVMALAALAGMVFVTSSMYVSIDSGTRLAAMRLGADAVIVPKGEGARLGQMLLAGSPSAVYMDGAVVEKAARTAGVEVSAPQVFLTSAMMPCCTVGDTVLVGFDPHQDLTVMPWIRGAMGSRPIENDEIVAGHSIINEKGGRLTFYGKLFTIAEKLDPSGFEYFDSSVFIPMESVGEMLRNSEEEDVAELNVPEGAVSAVFVQFEDGLDSARAVLRLALEMQGVDVVGASETVGEIRQRMLMPVRTLVAAAVVQWAVSLMLVGAVFSLMLAERAREFGLLVALGATGRDVLGLALAEAALLAGTGASAGSMAGLLALVLSGRGLFSLSGSVFVLPSSSVLLMLLVSVFVFTFISSLIACALPLMRVGRIAPFDSLISRVQD